MKQLLKNNWIKSIAINIIILVAVIVCTHMTYETNDDYAIASRIAAGYPYIGFVNYYLCKVAIALQGICGELNVYILGQIALSWFAFVVVLKVMLDAGQDIIARAIAVVTIMLFSIDHYCTIQFSKTAALLMVVGVLLIVDGITRKRKTAYYIIGFILMYLGVGFRADALLGALGFAGIYGIVWLVSNRKRLIGDDYFTPRKIASYILIIAFIAGAMAFDLASERVNVGTSELQKAQEYNIYRSNAVDFGAYDSYQSNESAYKKIGIDENDMYLIDHWFFDYDGAASLENLKKIDAVKQQTKSYSVSFTQICKKFVKGSWRNVRKLTNTGVHLIFLCGIALLMMLTLRPKHWIYIIAIGGLTCCLYLYLYYLQRPNYRALYIADIGAAMWLLYYYITNRRENGATYRKGILAVTVIAALLLGISMTTISISNSERAYVKTTKRIEPAVLAEYFRNNEENFYVVAAQEKKLEPSYLIPWKKPVNEKNVIGSGSWGTKSIYLQDKLKKYNIENPIREAVGSNSIYYVGNKNIKRIEKYLNKWYGDKGLIKLVCEENISGYQIWKVTH